jgi:glutamate racemase
MNNAAIGFFDSGWGGLSIMKAARVVLPHEDFVYVADCGHAPYGDRSHEYIVERSRAITDF